jgi:cytochrome c oxidase subunit III
MTRAVVSAGDVSALPDFAFGPASIGWWGVFGYMLIEGMAFALAIGAYFYLLPIDQGWPPYGTTASPPLPWGTAFTLVALLSEIPNVWTSRRAHACDSRGVRIGCTITLVFGLALLVVRGFELAMMNVRWDQNAYGSIVWALLALHTLHTTTEVGDDSVVCAMTWRKKMTGRRFSDVADNCLYWHFIVGSWLVLYVIVYWVPRWA